LDPLLPNESPASCLTCHYPLRDLTVNRCPECGREFDPKNPKTMYLPSTPGVVEQYLCTPPGRTYIWSGVSVSSLMLLANGFFGEAFPIGSCCSCWLCLLLAVWPLRILWTALSAEPGQNWLRAHGGTVWRWFAPPAVFFVALILVLFNVPLRLTFLASRPAMDQFAQQTMLLPIGTKDRSYHRIGLYITDYVERGEDKVSFSIGAGFHFQTWGFVYSPSGPPQNMGRARQHMQFSGPWYLRVSAFK